MKLKLQRGLHGVAAAVHAACFGYGVDLLLRKHGPPGTEVVYRNYEYAKAGSESYYYADPRDRTLAWPSPLGMHTIVALATTLSHVLQFWLHGYPWYVRRLETSRANEIRWVEYSITATAITLANTAATGIMGFPLFMCLTVAGIAQQMVGMLLERLRDRAFEIRVLFFVGSILQFGVTVFLIQRVAPPSSTADMQLVGTIAYGVFYSLFGLLAAVDVVLNTGWPYAVVDGLYIVLSLTSKQALFWITVSDALGWIEPTPALSRPTATWAFGVTVPTVTLLAVGGWLVMKR